MMNQRTPSPFDGGRGRGWGSGTAMTSLVSGGAASKDRFATLAPKTPIPCPFPHKRGKGE
jgi:hypothetical protein